MKHDDDIYKRFSALLPLRWVICDRCEGEGTVDHPAFSNGITASEWNNPDDWDDESRENYIRGAYDVPCPHCRGSGKVKEFSDEGCSPWQVRLLRRVRAIIAARDNARAEVDAMYEAERRFGA